MTDFIERRRNLSDDEFLREYAIPLRPVVLEGAAAHWPALQSWSVDGLLARGAHVHVPISRNDRKFAPRTRMPLPQYVRYMRQLAWRDEFPWYLVSWHFEDDFPDMLADFEIPTWCRDNWLDDVPAALRPRLLWMFIGPRWSGSWLHTDTGDTSAWNAQVSGRKRWILFSPDQSPLLYDGEVNAADPDLKAHPLFADARPLVADLDAGDIIFTPSGWWHQTVNLEEGIALTGNYADATNCDAVLRWLDVNEALIATQGAPGLRPAFAEVVACRRALAV